MNTELAQRVMRGELSLARYGGGSTFRSSSPGSAIWFVVRDGRAEMYRSQGLTAVKLIQCALGATPDGWWGPMTSAAMRKHAEIHHPDLDRAFVRDGSITAEMLRYGLSASFGTPFSLNDQSMSNTLLPPGTALPRWMQQSSVDGGYAGLAWHSEYPMAPSMPSPTTHPRYGMGLPCAGQVGRGRVIVAPMQTVPSGSLDNAPRPVTHLMSWLGAFLSPDGPVAQGNSSQILGGALLLGLSWLIALATEEA